MNVLDIDEWRMTMQIKREVVQEAIDALERYQVKRMDFDRFADEITALREALAQPEPEPVAWMYESDEDYIFTQNKDYAKFMNALPLYLAPPASEVPAGWKPVPIEPTKEMSDAFWVAYIPAPEIIAQSTSFEDYHDFIYMYKAMLSAAPEVPAGYDLVPKEWINPRYYELLDDVSI